MSKVIYACSRNKAFCSNTKEKLIQICDNLAPDNINIRPQRNKICVEGTLAYAVYMDNSAIQEHQMSLLLGVLYENHTSQWSEPKKNYPDGNFALFRSNEDEIEVVSDCAGTRTVWYYHDDQLFIASTSQRAIIMYIESFSFNKSAMPWILSTGSLGPNLSWDKRVKRLQADSSLLLDRKDWHISVNQNPTIFAEESRQPQEHKELINAAIRQSIESFGTIDFKQWVLPLSGGYDSRGILCFIKDVIGIPDNLRAVTWGLEESMSEEGNDAKVAKDLAHSIGVQHEYYHTDISSEPIETIIDRFLFCSEGRIDHIGGYMDGMEIWKRFYDDNITGVIRGDEGFGWNPVSSELTVRTSVGCGFCSDFKNLSHIANEFELPTQELPQDLHKREEETLDAWRDRLYHSYRLPTILSALSDIKFSYVEQINPLLSKSILNAVRSLPDNLRTDKFLFRSIVESISPNVPFATKGANAYLKDILRSRAFAELLKSEICSDYATNLFGEKFTDLIIKGIKVGEVKPRMKKRNIKSLINSMLPKSIKNILRDTIASPTVDSNILAFRVYIIIKMHKMLTEDSNRMSS